MQFSNGITQRAQAWLVRIGFQLEHQCACVWSRGGTRVRTQIAAACAAARVSQGQPPEIAAVAPGGKYMTAA